METRRSPLDVTHRAYGLGQRVRPRFVGRFRRHDFTRPRPHAYLAVREALQLSYPKAEAFLAEVPLEAPDRNTLRRSFGPLLRARRLERVLDRPAKVRAFVDRVPPGSC